jgi:Zn-dependent peptidase ImmA (M78 family)/transcriptional regulator with XRE-family HTH domain
MSAISMNEVGSKLRTAREVRGLSGEVVADAVGISRQLYNFYETGERPIPLNTLHRTAAVLGRTVDNLLSSHDAPPLALASVHFRTEAAQWAESARSQLLWLDSALRFYAELLDEMDVDPCAALESPLPAPSKRAGREEAERAARRVRDHLNLGPGALPAVFDLADRDVMTFRLPFGADLVTAPSGFFFKDQRAGLCVVVNADQTAGRQHFTFAHELAHAYFHSHRSGGLISMNGSTEAKERFANDFAREFLMPTDLVHAIVESRPEWSCDPSQAGVVLELQRTFQVSFIAMAVQLRRLGLLTQDQLAAMSGLSPGRLAALRGLPPSPLDRPPAPLHRFEQIPSCYRWLVICAVERGLVSLGDVAENLVVSSEDVRRLLDTAPEADGQELAFNRADLALA